NLTMTASQVTGSGTLNINGTLTTNASGTSSIIVPQVNLNAAAETVDVAANATLILSGTVSASGNLIKTGAGMLQITGTLKTSGQRPDHERRQLDCTGCGGRGSRAGAIAGRWVPARWSHQHPRRNGHHAQDQAGDHCRKSRHLHAG